MTIRHSLTQQGFQPVTSPVTSPVTDPSPTRHHPSPHPSPPVTDPSPTRHRPVTTRHRQKKTNLTPLLASTTMSQLIRALIIKERNKKLRQCNSIPQQNIEQIKISISLDYSIFGGRND